jgi:hypothetical protein
MDKDNFLVDFRCITADANFEDHGTSTNTFAFFDACTKLITALAIGS